MIPVNWAQERNALRTRVLIVVLLLGFHVVTVFAFSAVAFRSLLVLSVADIVFNLVAIRWRWRWLPTLNLFLDQVFTVLLLAVSGAADGPLVFLVYVHLVSALVFFGRARVVLPMVVLQITNLLLAAGLSVLWGHEAGVTGLLFHSAGLILIGVSLSKPASVLHTDANIDTLTQVLNRRAGLRTLQGWQKSLNTFDVLFTDLKQFKAVNDTYGHLVGDEVLREIASCIQESIRDDDLVIRYGGDEFLIATKTQATRIAQRLEQRLQMPINTSAGALRIQVDIGVAHYPADATDLYDLIHLADKQMFEQKSRTSKNR